jgi:hypothetical protein
MGLTFSVGSPDSVFVEPFARAVRSWLTTEFGEKVSLELPIEHYWSDEVAWSGWAELQALATEHLPAENLEHLTSMEAWSGVYLPLMLEPCAMDFPGQKTPLDVASLPALIAELEALGAALELPTDRQGLQSLVAKYGDDDDLVDQDMDIQTYAQLLLSALEATDRRQPLWVVK